MQERTLRTSVEAWALGFFATVGLPLSCNAEPRFFPCIDPQPVLDFEGRVTRGTSHGLAFYPTR